MAALDAVSLTIMFGALLVLAGILSSLVALRFGAPLLLVFLLVGMLAGESGPGGVHFDDVNTTYLVGSVALALILFGFDWVESLLVGAVVSSTDAAAVFLLIHSRGLRLRPRVGATLEIESATNDPFAIFLTIVLVGVQLRGSESWVSVLDELAIEAIGGAVIGFIGGRA